MPSPQSPQSPNLVIVRWNDAVTGHGWKDSSDPPLVPEVVRSIGYLVQRTRQSIVIAADIDDAEGLKARNREITIPFGMVLTITNALTGDILFTRTRRRAPVPKEP